MRRAAITFGITGLALFVAGLVIFRDIDFRRAPAPAPVAAPAPPPAPVVVNLPARAMNIWELPASVAPDRPRILPRRPPTAQLPPVAAAATTTIPVPAVAMPAAGTLRVASDVPGAQVFLDRQFIGAAPVTSSDVPVGSHQLNVSAPGYDSHVQTIEVTPGLQDVMVTFRVVRLNASIDVVHKHLIGSCRGRLIATPKGLRYETADNDAFGATLLDLETFQVDYLNKNLRLQPRKGKRYDFTDPEGNADRLLIFHRDVERARERLKRGDVPVTE